jgi:hypothetical protein
MVRVEQQARLRLHAVERGGVGRELRFEGIAPRQQQVGERAFAELVGARLQLRALRDLLPGMPQLLPGGARLLRLARGAPCVGADALARAFVLLLRHFGLRGGSLCVGAAACAAQRDRQVSAPDALFAAALAPRAHAHRGVARALLLGAAGLQARLRGARLREFELVVVGEDFLRPVGHRNVGAVQSSLFKVGVAGQRQARVLALQGLLQQLRLGARAHGLRLDARGFGLRGQGVELGGFASLHAALDGGKLRLRELGLRLQHLGAVQFAQRIEPVAQQRARGLVPGVGVGNLADLQLGFAVARRCAACRASAARFRRRFLLR